MRRDHQRHFKLPDELEQTQSCPYGFSIYVYDLFNGEGQTYLRQSLAQRDPFCQNDCSDAQFSTEIQVWRYLLQSPCRTKDTTKADLFYIPFLDTLEYYTKRKQITAPALYQGLVERNWTSFSQVRSTGPKCARD
jgi:hypothetical protein